MSDDVKIRWSAIDPLKREIVLREDTFDCHINRDHEKADATYRISVEKNAKHVIESPRLIVKDKTDKTRENYINLEMMPTENGEVKIRCMQVIVDTSTRPHEVVTYIPQNKIKLCIKAEESIVYDSDKTEI